jgi:GNAT superfamily N-acetyltransferase
MNPDAHIRVARWADITPITALAADALYATPLGQWLIPDPRQRRRILANVVAIWVEHAMFFGDIHLTDDLTAAIVGFHRYRPIPPPARYHIRLGDAAGVHVDRFDQLDALVTREQPTEPHYHLAFLAVHPDAQRAGRGAALLAHHQSRLDRINLPAWTAVAPGGEHLLARYDYTPRPAVSLPDGGPTLHPMRRNAHHRSRSVMPVNTTRPVDNRWQDFHA